MARLTLALRFAAPRFLTAIRVILDQYQHAEELAYPNTAVQLWHIAGDFNRLARPAHARRVA
jgi:hypothetical protein